MPGTKVHLFGSRAVGLHLPYADMDMVLQLPAREAGATQVEARAGDNTALLAPALPCHQHGLPPAPASRRCVAGMLSDEPQSG